jgi:hypothetical protein
MKYNLIILLMCNIIFADALQAEAIYKNTNKNLVTTNATVWFNKIISAKLIVQTPKYISNQSKWK